MKKIVNPFALLVATSRPISWVNTAYPFSAGYLIYQGEADILFWLGTLFFLIPYNLMMYGINDVFDYESDIRNPRKGGIEGAITPKSAHRTIVLASTLSAAPFFIALLLLGTPLANVVLTVVMFFVVAYSVKGLRFKEIPVLDSVTSSVHFVGPLVYALALSGFPESAWPYVLAFFLWGMASQAFGAVQDIVPDRQAKINSVATVLGAHNTVRLSALLYSLSAVLVGAQGSLALVIAIAGLAYVANVLPYANITDKNSASSRAGWKRFMLLNYGLGAIVTICLILVAMA